MKEKLKIKNATENLVEFTDGLSFYVEEGYLTYNNDVPTSNENQIEYDAQVPYCEVIPQMELPLTHRCNLNCTYCSFRGRMKDRKDLDMSDEIIDKSLNFYKNYLNREKIPYARVDFGVTGEPFLRKNDHERINNKVKKAFDDADSYKIWAGPYISNGTFSVIGDMLNDFCNVQDVSCDGPENIHNSMRRYPDGKGTFYDLIKALSSIKDKKPKFGVSAVLTSENPDFAGIFSFLHNKLGFDSIYMKPVNSNPDVQYGLNEDTLEIFKSAYTQLIDYIIGQNHDNMLSSLLSLSQEDFFMRFFYRIKNRSRQIYRCGCGKSGIYVDTDGTCYPCAHFIGLPQYSIGNINLGIIEDKKQLFTSLTVYNREPCKKCWARFLCGGGCYYQSLLSNGTIEKPDKAKCELIKHLIIEAIRLYVFLKKEAFEVLAALPSGYLISSADIAAEPSSLYMPKAIFETTTINQSIPVIRENNLKNTLYDKKLNINMNAEKRGNEIILKFEYGNCPDFYVDIWIIDINKHPFRKYDLYNQRSFFHGKMIRIDRGGKAYKLTYSKKKVEEIPYQPPHISEYSEVTVLSDVHKLEIHLPLDSVYSEISSLLGVNININFKNGGTAALISREPYAILNIEEEGFLKLSYGEFDKDAVFSFSSVSELEISGMVPIERWCGMKPNVC